MKKNIGTPDRLFRLAIAIGLLIYAYMGQSWIALAASLFVFFEAAMSWCVLYQLLGKNSCPRK
ncbi:MAG: DUF2892 domain-containing protein [Verrucomicrobiota bacterium]|nr:DUF2892 domain-containing protein [Verrucomicrobiota bacterium]